MVAIVNDAGTAVTALGGDTWRVERLAGLDGYNASAISAAAIAGDFVLRVRPVTTGLNGFFAATADPDSTLDFSGLIYGDQLWIYHGAVFQPPVVAFDDTLWIERAGSDIRYRTGAVHAAAPIVHSVAGVTAPLWFDSAIETVDGVAEVRFAAPGGWLDPTRRPRSRIALGPALQF